MWWCHAFLLRFFWWFVLASRCPSQWLNTWNAWWRFHKFSTRSLGLGMSKSMARALATALSWMDWYDWSWMAVTLTSMFYQILSFSCCAFCILRGEDHRSSGGWDPGSGSKGRRVVQAVWSGGVGSSQFMIFMLNKKFLTWVTSVQSFFWYVLTFSFLYVLLSFFS